jgi:hypothetical protein
VTGRHFAALNDQPLPQCCIQLIQSSGCRMAGAAIERAGRSMIPPQELESPVWHRQPIDELCIAEQRSVLPLLQSSYPRMPRRTDGDRGVCATTQRPASFPTSPEGETSFSSVQEWLGSPFPATGVYQRRDVT